MMKINSVNKFFGILIIVLMTILTISNSALAFDVSMAVYDDVSFSVIGQDINPKGLAFNTDGTKMFVVGDDGNDVNEYTLGTGFDVSTASFVDSFSVAGQETQPTDVSFNTDGTKMFVLGANGDDVNEYTLSTGFDVSTASFVDSFSVAGQEIVPNGLAFSADGTKMFVVGWINNAVNEYTLSTGFDVSTASFVDSFSVAGQEAFVLGVTFNTDGTKMFVIGADSDDVNEYTLSTGFDVSTASFVDSFSVAGQDINPEGLVFNSDGTKMFMIGSDSDAVYQYSITPPATAPSAPTSLSATEVSSSQVDLSWTAPDDGGSAITGYKIERKLNSGSYTTLVADTGSTATTYSDTTVDDSNSYTYKVSAINSVGTSDASSEASVTVESGSTASGSSSRSSQSSSDNDEDTLTPEQRDNLQRQINEIRELIVQLIELIQLKFGITISN